MTSLLLCAAAFSLTYFMSRRSLWQGLATLLAIGYLYGLIRANLLQAFSHLLFDSGVLGVYAAQFRPNAAPQGRPGPRGITVWLILLTAWPTLLFFFFRTSDPVVELVGWRANVFVLPFLVLGARLDEGSLQRLGLVLAGLNIAAVAIGGLQFFVGIEPFFPRSEVTEMLYRSRLEIDPTDLRIPSTFVNAHAYAATLVTALPLVFGAWTHAERRWHSLLLAFALAASFVGVFMAAARTHMIVLGVLVALATFSSDLRRIGRFQWIKWAGLVAVVAWIVASDPRLQRFLTLQDTGVVTERFKSSVNQDFFDLMGQYPLGNGLAGGGTSIPYFLTDRSEANFVMENEFARIVLEEGIPGLFLWVLFMLWAITQSPGSKSSPWHSARRLAMAAYASYFVAALTGIGLLTSIPQSSLLLLSIGWVGNGRMVTSPSPSVARRATARERLVTPA